MHFQVSKNSKNRYALKHNQFLKKAGLSNSKFSALSRASHLIMMNSGFVNWVSHLAPLVQISSLETLCLDRE